MIRAQVLICGGTGCTSSGSKSIQEAFAKNLEANGLTDETIEKCTKKITIPMAGKAESLNAGVAASLIMWEMSKC